MLRFEMLIPVDPDAYLGSIPMFLSERDEDSAKQQLDKHYSHGGGWNPLEGWTLDLDSGVISYPGDPPLPPVAKAVLREETIYVYPHAWVAVVQKDGSYEIARMD